MDSTVAAMSGATSAGFQIARVAKIVGLFSRVFIRKIAGKFIASTMPLAILSGAWLSLFASVKAAQWAILSASTGISGSILIFALMVSACRRVIRMRRATVIVITSRILLRIAAQ